MRVLLTGAGGVLGQNLVPYLIDRGVNDLVLSDICDFDISSFSKMKGVKIAFQKGDLRDRNFVKEIVKNIDVLVHTAAATPSYPDDIVYSTIIDATRNLLEESFSEGINRFVYVSSTSVYGVPEKSPVYEDETPMPYDAYNKSKIAAEKICHEFRNKGMCIPVLRPRTFIGPGRLGSFILLFEWASEGKNFPMVGKGINRYQFLDVDDLCQAIYLTITKPSYNINDTFNIGAKDFTCMKEDFHSVLEIAGFGKKIITMPSKPVLFLFRILEKLKLSPLYKRLYEKLNRDYYVSIDKAIEKLDYRPQYSNKESLQRNYLWYLKNRDSFINRQGEGNNVPWKQGIFRFAKVFF